MELADHHTDPISAFHGVLRGLENAIQYDLPASGVLLCLN
jgi:hypothetical protein